EHLLEQDRSAGGRRRCARRFARGGREDEGREQGQPVSVRHRVGPPFRARAGACGRDPMRSVPAPDVTVTPLTPCAASRSGRYVLLEPPQEKVVLSPRSRTLAAALAVLVAFAALVLARDAVPAASQAVWEHLGMRRVNFRLDHDVILAATEGRFRSIRIVVAGGDLELFDVKV